jgi:hypothetical protein
VASGCSSEPTSESSSDRASAGGEPAAAATPSLSELRARYGVLAASGDVRALPAGPEGRIAELANPGAAGKSRAEVAFDGGRVTVREQASQIGVAFSLRLTGTREAGELTIDDGMIVGEADAGTQSLYRVNARGVEDFVVVDSAPRDGALSYDIEALGARALRLVDGTLEVLDAYGAPRLRVRRPYVIDANGVRHAAELEVHDCAVDRDPRAPWGRELTELDRDRCRLAVRYDTTIAHPVLVDPEWQVAAFMATARTHHTATLLPTDGTVLVTGGFDENGVALASTEILCPEEAACGGIVSFASGPPLPSARGAHAESYLATSNRVLVTGGRASRAATTGLNVAHYYDVGLGSWSSAGTLSVGRWGHTSTALNDGRALIVAGEDGAAASSAQIYDAATGFGAPLPMAGHRRGHVAEILNDGRVLVAGGIGSVGNQAVASAELFDPAGAGSFAAIADQMSAPRAFATATRLEDAAGRVLIVGGTNNLGFYSQTIDIFDPTNALDPFAQTGVSMTKARAFHTATKLTGEQKVLIAGGFDGADVQDDTEVYDQLAGDFNDLLSTTMTRGHDFHTANRLPSGKVVVIGGGIDGTPTAPGSGTVDVIAASQAEILARVNGEPCDIDGECLSNHCYEPPNGICCNESCTDICTSCRASEQAIIPPEVTPPGNGTCSVVTNMTTVNPQCAAGVQLILQCNDGELDVSDVEPCEPYICDDDTDQCSEQCGNDTGCHEDYFCVATVCHPAYEDGHLGCTRDAQCLNDHCVDGVCCNSECEGQCQACDVAGFEGTCTQVEGEAPHPNAGGTTQREPCEGAGSACEGICGGNPLKCDYDQTVACGASTCDGGVRDFGLCSLDVEGECAAATSECAPFACDPEGVACVTECETVTDCETGAVCRSDGTCAIVENAECVDDHTVADPAGTQTDCSPLRCENNSCLKSCGSVDDCVDGFVCDDAGACIEPPEDPPPPDDCALRGAPRSSSGSLVLGLALAGLAFASRRSRREVGR